MLVLIVEPEGPFRVWLRRTLDEAGLGHVEAEDVFEAQELIASTGAELVALGPSLDLAGAVAASRRFARRAAVVAFLNNGDEAAAARLREAGVSATLARPLAPAPTAERLRRAALDRFAGRVVEMLALRGGETLSRDAILDRLYAGRPEACCKIVDVTICTLRRKLRGLLSAPVVETRRGGYAFASAAARAAVA